jgi:hypothetical protein
MPALKLDARSGDTPIWRLIAAGGNLERDLATITRLAAPRGARRASLQPALPTATTVAIGRCGCSTARCSRTAETYHRYFGRRTRKHPLIKNSPPRADLGARSWRLKLYDPVVPACLPPRAPSASSALAVVKGADGRHHDAMAGLPRPRRPISRARWRDGLLTLSCARCARCCRSRARLFHPRSAPHRAKELVHA